jgi:TP901 family phage tail tape measure protein
MADASSVLVRLQLLGASRFKRDAQGAGASLKGIAAGGRAAGAGLGRVGREATRAQSALGRVRSAGNGARKELGGIASQATALVSPLKTAAFAAVGLGFGAAIKSGVDFESTMAGVQAKLLTTQGNMRRLNALALELGAKTQFSANEAAGAMQELAAQGFTTNQIMKVLPGTLSLAAASGVELADAAQIQTETLHGFGLSAGQAGRVADVLAQVANRSAAQIDDMQESLKYIAPVAKASGQSLEDMGAAIGLMANVGIRGSQAGTTLRTAMVRLTNPTEKGRSALHKLGLTAKEITDAKRGLIPLPRILEKFAAGAQNVDKPTRNAALAAIFGREALSGMVALVEKGPKRLNALSSALEHSGGAAKRAANIQRKTVKGAFDNLQGSVETAAISLTQRFAPATRTALNSMARLVNKATSGKGALAQFATGLSTGQAAPRVTRDVGGRNVKVAQQASVFQRAGAAVNKAVASIARNVGPIGAKIVAAFKPAEPFLKNVILPLLGGIAKGVLGSVVAAFNVLLGAIKIVATALGWLGQKLAFARGFFNLLGQVIGFVAGGPILKALGALGKLGLVFRILRIPIAAMGGAVRGVGRVLGLVGKGVGAFVGRLQNMNRWLRFAEGRFAALLGKVTNFALGVIGRLERLPGQAIGQIRSMISGMLRRLGSAPAAFLRAAGHIGRAIINGVVNAIKSAPGEIASALLSIVPGPKSVVTAVAGKLGIGRATGGPLTSPITLVGERGPELLVGGGRGQVVTASQTRRLLGRQPTAMAPGGQQIVIRFQPVLDGRVLHDSVHRVERAMVEAS